MFSLKEILWQLYLHDQSESRSPTVDRTERGVPRVSL